MPPDATAPLPPGLSPTAPIAPGTATAPFAIRLAQAALVLFAALTGLAGLGSCLVCAGAPWLDPTLGADVSLPIVVLLLTGLVWVGGAGVAVATTFALGAGHPAGRVLASLIGVAALLTPVFLLGVLVLWAVWLDEDGRAWEGPRRA